MSNYEIWLGDDQGTRLITLNNTSGFRLIKRLNRPGYFAIDLPLSFDRTLIRRDARVEIWRKDFAGKLDLEFLGLLRQFKYKTDRSGNTKITISGPDLNDLLNRRHVLYLTGSSEATASAKEADDLLKRIVDENMGGSATDADRDFTATGELTIQGDLTAGPTITRTLSFKNVLDLCQDIAEASRQKGTNLYFGIVPHTPKNWEFITRTGQWGQDRTIVGNQGVIGLEFGNLSDPQYEVDWNGEITNVTGLGQGEGAGRNTQEIEDATRVKASRFNRIEAVKDARRESAAAGIQDAAREVLESNRPRRRFRGRIVQTKAFVYGRDWGHGDKLSWTYLGEQGDAFVQLIDIRVNGKGEEKVSARLEALE